MANTKKTVSKQITDKKQINLAGYGTKKMNVPAAIVGVVIIVLAAAIFSKFAVADRISKVQKAKREVNALQAEVDEGLDTIDSFSDTNSKYAHYTYSGMTEDELALRDRMEIIEMLERDVFSKTEVSDFTIDGNTITMPMKGATLQDINLIAADLEQEDMVYYCTVTTATDDGKSGTSAVTAQVTIYLYSDETETTGADTDANTESGTESGTDSDTESADS